MYRVVGSKDPGRIMLRFLCDTQFIEKPYFLGRKYGVSRGRKYVLTVMNPILRFVAAWDYMWVLRHENGYLR